MMFGEPLTQGMELILDSKSLKKPNKDLEEMFAHAEKREITREMSPCYC
jgi:hypothetical protein